MARKSTEPTRLLSWRQVVVICLAVFVSPFWIINYETLLQKYKWHELLADWAAPIVLAPLEFLSSGFVRGVVLGALLYALSPLIWRSCCWLWDRRNGLMGRHGDTYDGGHHELMLFVIDHLLPTVDQLREVQERIIDLACEHAAIRVYAKNHLSEHAGSRSLQEAVERLSGLLSSPPEYIPLDDMIRCVAVIERRYDDLVTQAQQLATPIQASMKTGEGLGSPWQRWHASHQAMLAAYEPIKRDSRLGKLFRPGKAGRWDNALDFD